MGGEIMFYNGFNLMIDLIVGFAVFYITRSIVSKDAFRDGFYKALHDIERGVLFQKECNDEVKWTYDLDNCSCDNCIPTPNNVTPLFSSREAD